MKRKLPYLVITGIVIFIFIVAVVRQIGSSLFFLNKDRINIVVYGKDTVFYSIGKRDGVHYFISFFPDVKIKVPGGYGNYRVGGIGYLVHKEKKPTLIQAAFSAATSSTVDRFFYDDSSQVYYGESAPDADQFSFPTLRTLFFRSSNGNIFDRLYIAGLFFTLSKGKFSPIPFTSMAEEGDEIFKDRDFGKKYLGYFYNRVFRDEKKTVQVAYVDDPEANSYKTALYISNIIEGDGIRVVDITETDNKPATCEVIEQDARHPSASSLYIAGFFHCMIKQGKPQSSDIIINLGDLQKRWEIL